MRSSNRPSSIDALAHVKQLLTGGRFGEALATVGEVTRSRSNGLDFDVLRVMLLERVGHYAHSRELANRLLQSKGLEACDRSSCEYTLGVIDWDEGRTDSGIEHIQRSILLAKRAHALERICWSQLRLWLMLANRCDADAATPVLAEARSNAIKLGDPHVLAALHVFVGETEAKRGLLSSAQFHSRTALNLMAAEPNPWLEAWAENINVGVAILLSRIETGLAHGSRAVALAETAGAAATLRACLANFGNLLYLAGRLDEAIEYFQRAIAVLPSGGDNGHGAIEAIASIRLAQDRFEEADQLLGRIEASILTPDDRKLYVYRHASLTRVRFLIRQGRWPDALKLADELAGIAVKTGDQILHAMTCQVRAEALLCAQGVTSSLQAISTLVPTLPELPSDFYARYEALLASALRRSGSEDAATIHVDRARRILTCVGSAPVLLELERDWKAPCATTRSESLETTPVGPALVSAKVALQGAAALLVYGREPEFVARELVRLLTDSGCAKYAGAIATTSSNGSWALEERGTSSGQVTRINVGVSRSRNIELALDVNADIESTATVNAVRLLLWATRELERARAEREEHVRLWPADDVETESAGAVVTGQMQTVMSFARRVARTNVGVLITGESGTGKEILARAIHGYSTRAEKPFVPFNCTAIPREMLESQLFGHRRGAFTGADRDNPGLIRSAKEGTLFLDEIGELGLDLQPKLLRFLESGEICPLGEPSPFTVDVRIVAATNSNLEQLVHDGRFREDLFYRLNVIRLTIPPLRERRDEIPALVHHFVARAAAEFSKGRLRVTEETMEHLLLYPWPGNVRQLQNELRRMAALAEIDSVLTPAALAPDIRNAAAKAAPARADASPELAVPLTEKLTPTLSRIESEMIKVALRTHHGRVDAAAKALGISRKGLYLKRQRLGL